MRPQHQRSANERFALALLSGAMRAALGSTALGLTLAAPLAIAAEPAAGARAHAIAPGPLADALAQYAAATGVQLVYEQSTLAGLRSPGLQGRYTESEGFAQLLRGSGYEVVSQGRATYVLRKSAAPAQSGTTLDAITVTAAAMPAGTTEGSGSYAAASSNTSTKLNLSQRETPQTVTVITREQMDDAGMTSVDDALRAVSGIFAMDGGSGQHSCLNSVPSNVVRSAIRQPCDGSCPAAIMR